jgi:hypothetical protein
MKDNKLKDIPGFSQYSVDINGNVFSNKTKKYIKPYITKSNSVRVFKLQNDRDGKYNSISVIKTIALAWLPNPFPTLYNYAINKSGNHSDTTINNVMWGTSSMAIKRKMLRRPDLVGRFVKSAVHIDNRKMTDDLEADLIKMHNTGYSARQLSDIFPIKTSQVYNIINKHKQCA